VGAQKKKKKKKKKKKDREEKDKQEALEDPRTLGRPQQKSYQASGSSSFRGVCINKPRHSRPEQLLDLFEILRNDHAELSLWLPRFIRVLFLVAFIAGSPSAFPSTFLNPSVFSLFSLFFKNTNNTKSHDPALLQTLRVRDSRSGIIPCRRPAWLPSASPLHIAHSITKRLRGSSGMAFEPVWCICD
jgi:hypothetical protein